VLGVVDGDPLWAPVLLGVEIAVFRRDPVRRGVPFIASRMCFGISPRRPLSQPRGTRPVATTRKSVKLVATRCARLRYGRNNGLKCAVRVAQSDHSTHKWRG
jgi:hypothetical protein